MITFYDRHIADGGFYINLDSRTDRKEKVLNQLDKYNICGVERMPAVIKGQYAGCGESHKNIIKLAIDRGYDSVLALEDDFYIMDPPSTGRDDYHLDFKQSMNLYLDQAFNIEWDVMFFGAILHSPLIKVSDNLGRIQSAKSAHAFIIKKQVFPDILAWSYEKYDQLDHYFFTKLQKKWKFISSYPLLINHGWPEPDLSNLLNFNTTYYAYIVSTYAEFATSFRNEN
jgi:GR25 family glycosyltransferase involved in LPS biosynthesis